MAVDGSGNLYIADPLSDVVEKVTPGGTLSIIAGTGHFGRPTAGPATSSNLNHPDAVAVDSSGNVYIADTNNDVVEKVTPGGTLTIFAGNGLIGTPDPWPGDEQRPVQPGRRGGRHQRQRLHRRHQQQ